MERNNSPQGGRVYGPYLIAARFLSEALLRDLCASVVIPFFSQIYSPFRCFMALGSLILPPNRFHLLQ